MFVYNESSHYSLFYQDSVGGSQNLSPPKWGDNTKMQTLFLGGIAQYMG